MLWFALPRAAAAEELKARGAALIFCRIIISITIIYMHIFLNHSLDASITALDARGPIL